MPHEKAIGEDGFCVEHSFEIRRHCDCDGGSGSEYGCFRLMPFFGSVSNELVLLVLLRPVP